ncbi:SDR family NAD(P)-dependent oxidoreductase [Thermoflavimicrobium daqui]|uniref:Short-chain dehydrogenase n=1 Tax=Thermoflavimicrobium daqui TaxID=2137476 RepID=A0A364K4H7_9BACL|nr:SDR family oxidoreductase [Thermoflavimicrobium daqui]RAL24262.1 short-chain dehydrogenase [Thermoflavimicrobium daqui]
MSDSYALITGASYGIGREIAECFARDQVHLVLVARSKEKLEQLKEEWEAKYQIRIILFIQDLTQPAAVQKVYEEIVRMDIKIDYLVNNAGYGLFGFFIETDIQEELDMIELNIKSLTHLTKLFLPRMIERGYGKILNVASTAAFQPGPLMSVYYATKAYVLSFTEALANELKDTGVTATVLCPGPTETHFAKRAKLGQSPLFKKGIAMDAKTVAVEGYKKFLKGKTIVTPGWKNRFLIKGIRFLPRKVITAIIRRVQEVRKK